MARPDTATLMCSFIQYVPYSISQMKETCNTSIMMTNTYLVLSVDGGPSPSEQQQQDVELVGPRCVVQARLIVCVDRVRVGTCLHQGGDTGLVLVAHGLWRETEDIWRVGDRAVSVCHTHSTCLTCVSGRLLHQNVWLFLLQSHVLRYTV